MSNVFQHSPLATIKSLQGIFYDDFFNSGDIPLLRPAVSRKAVAEIHRVFSSGWIGEGEEVYRFEAVLAEILGVQHVVTVNSGTSAIDLAIELLNLQAGDTVISTPLTCAATNIPLLRRGIRIQWADIDARSAVLSAASVAANIDEHTKAILTVDLHGVPSHYDELRKIADDYGIPIIADCAQAIGATYAGRQASAYADICCYSFQSVKTLTTADGGAVAFNNPAFLKRATKLRWFGIDRAEKAASPTPWFSDIEEAGFKYHMNNVMAAIGLSNLTHLSAVIAHQKVIAAVYEARIENNEWIQKLEYTSAQTPTFPVYPILISDRNHFVQYMRKNGIEANPIHQDNDKLSAFHNSSLTVASKDGNCGMNSVDPHLACLPTGYWMDQSRMDRVIETVRKYRGKSSAT